MRILALLLFTGMIVGSCTQKSATSSKEINSYESIAYEALNVEPVRFKENGGGEKATYVLATYYDNRSGIPADGSLKFVVINIETEEIIKKQSIPNGKVRWISEYELEIFAPPGIAKNNSETKNSYTSIYNVKTGKESKKGAAQN